MLPGWCCIAIAALELGNGDSWYHMCAFRFHFWGRKVNWNQASHVRASPVVFQPASVPELRRLCFRTGFVPTLLWPVVPVIPFAVGPFGPLGFPVPRGMHYRAMWRRALLQGPWRLGVPPRQDSEHRKDWKGIAQEHIWKNLNFRHVLL